MATTTHDVGRVEKLFRSLTAVDLITLVVFAALFRILFMIYKLAEIIFPWNHPAWYFFCMLCLAPAILIVRKIGAIFTFTIAWLAINFFFQGEIPLWWICAITVPLIPEAYMWWRSRQQGVKEAFADTKNLYVVGFVYTLLAYVSNMLLILFALDNPMPRWEFWPVGVLALILGLAGTWVGKLVGDRIAGLIG